MTSTCPDSDRPLVSGLHFARSAFPNGFFFFSLVFFWGGGRNSAITGRHIFSLRNPDSCSESQDLADQTQARWLGPGEPVQLAVVGAVGCCEGLTARLSAQNPQVDTLGCARWRVPSLSGVHGLSCVLLEVACSGVSAWTSRQAVPTGKCVLSPRRVPRIVLKMPLSLLPRVQRAAAALPPSSGHLRLPRALGEGSAPLWDCHSSVSVSG